jgi:hypothetical protein
MINLCLHHYAIDLPGVSFERVAAASSQLSEAAAAAAAIHHLTPVYTAACIVKVKNLI